MLDLFGSGLIRTWQSLLTIRLELGAKGYAHDPLLNMGSSKLFQTWNDAGWSDAFIECGTSIGATKKILGDDGFSQTCKACADDIRLAFQVMKSSHALGIFHTPTIEMAGLGLCYKFDGALAECAGLIFVHREDDSVEVWGLWKFDNPFPKIGSTE